MEPERWHQKLPQVFFRGGKREGKHGHMIPRQQPGTVVQISTGLSVLVMIGVEGVEREEGLARENHQSRKSDCSSEGDRVVN